MRVGKEQRIELWLDELEKAARDTEDSSWADRVFIAIGVRVAERAGRGLDAAVVLRRGFEQNSRLSRPRRARAIKEISAIIDSGVAQALSGKIVRADQ